MLVPVFENDARPPRAPWLCAGLAALWLGAFGLGSAGHPLPPEHFGLGPGAAALPGALGFFLLHTGGLHLGVSLLWLALAGPALEDRWGRTCLGVLLAGALGVGAATALHFEPAASRPWVGPSAGLAALLGAATWRFRREGVRLRGGFGRRFSLTFRIPAAALPVCWLAGAVLVRASDAATPASAGLDLPRQLGLAGGGALFAMGLGAAKLEARWLRRREAASRERAVASRLARAARELDADRPDAAYTELESGLSATPDGRVVAALIEAAESCGRRGDALARGALAVGEAWNAGRRALAAQLWAPLVRAEPDLHLDMRLRLALAPVLADAGLEREAALTLRGELRRERRDVTPGAALRIADAAREVSPDTAIEAARLALESDTLDAAKRARIEAMIEALESDPRRLAAPVLDAEPAPPAATAIPCDVGSDPDPGALALDEAPDALELDAPRTGDAADPVEDPRALVLDDGEPEASR